MPEFFLIKKETLAQVFSCEFWSGQRLFENNYSVEQEQAARGQ